MHPVISCHQGSIPASTVVGVLTVFFEQNYILQNSPTMLLLLSLGKEENRLWSKKGGGDSKFKDDDGVTTTTKFKQGLACVQIASRDWQKTVQRVDLHFERQMSIFRERIKIIMCWENFSFQKIRLRLFYQSNASFHTFIAEKVLTGWQTDLVAGTKRTKQKFQCFRLFLSLLFFAFEVIR